MKRLSGVKPFVAQFFLRVLPAGFSFLVAVLIVRNCGLASYGEYTVALTIATMTLVLVSNGLDSDALRRSTFDGADEYGAKLGAAIVLLPIYGGLVIWQGLPLLPCLVIFLAVTWSALADTRVVELRKEGKDLRALPVRLAPVCVFLLSLFIAGQTTFQSVSLLYFLAWCLVPLLLRKVLLASVASMKPAALKPRYDAVMWIVLSLLMTQVQANLDALILNKWLGADVVGRYRVAVLVGNLGLQVVGVASIIFLSRLGQSPDTAARRKLFWAQVKLNGGIGLAFLVLVAVAFNRVVTPLFKLAPGETMTLALIVAFGATLNGVAMAASYFLLAQGRDRHIFVGTAIATVVSVLGNVVAIPQFGALGAASVSAFTQGVSVVACFALLIEAGLLGTRHRSGDNR